MTRLSDLIRQNRSVRRYRESSGVARKTLEGLVNLARLSASAANLQPLKYLLSNNSDQNQEIFECLKWAGYLPEWPGPDAGERPAAYIVMLEDKSVGSSFTAVDEGIAAQSILLGAREIGLAGCMLKAFNVPKLARILEVPEGLVPTMVLALGEPVEEVVIEEMQQDGSVRYWRTEDQVHHVPKRSLEEIIVPSPNGSEEV